MSSHTALHSGGGDHHHDEHDHHSHSSNDNIPSSKYGIKGNFIITPILKQAAERFGLIVTRQKGEGVYELRSKHGGDALHKMMKGFDCEPARETGQAIYVDGDTLRDFLQFLHQPLNHTARNHTTGTHPHLEPNSRLIWKQAAFNAASDPTRKLLHSVLRMATTGNPTIPLYEDPELSGKESCECHADAENQMKDDDLWALEMEFFNPANQPEHDHITSAVPNTYYDPARGFVLRLHPDFVNESFHGQGQQQLCQKFWNALNVVTNGRYVEQKPDEIVLNAGELQGLTQEICAQSTDLTIQQNVGQAIFETRVQYSMHLITQDALSLSTNVSFLKTITDKGETGCQDEKLKQLMRATSALTPILTSPAMRRLWGRHKMTERVMGMDNPLDAVLEEIDVMQAVLSDYAHRGDATPAEMQAVANRFAHVMSFGQDIMEALDETAEKYQAKQNKKAAKGKVTDGIEYDALRQAFENSREAFEAPFLAGASHIEEDFLKPEYATTLDIFKKGLNQDGNLLIQSLRGGKDGFLEWTGDLISSSTENPVNFIIFAAVAAYLYHISGQTGADVTPEQIAEAVQVQFGQDGEFTVPDELVAALEQASQQAYEDAGLLRGYHYDYFGPFFRWKHYVSDELVAGWTKTLLGATPTGYNFSNAANKTADGAGDTFFLLNFIQNFAPHAAFYLTVTLKGSRSGFFNGFKHVLKLSAPILNVVGHAGLSAAEATPFKRKPHYDRLLVAEASQTGQILSGESPLALLGQEYRSHNGDNTPLSAAIKEAIEAQSEAIALAAGQLVHLEEEAEQEREAAKLSLKLGWQRKDFVVNGEIVTPLMQALREFDVTLAYISSKIGISDDWHQEDLQARLEAAIKAVQTYQATGDAEALQEALADNLDHLIGAEFRHTGHSEIYRAIFNQAASEKEERIREQELNTLERFHSAWVGRESRKEAIADSRAEVKDIKAEAELERRRLKVGERVDLAWKKLGRGTTMAWDKTVRAARTIHETYHLIPGKKPIALSAVTAVTAGIIYDAIVSGQGALGDGMVGQTIETFLNAMAGAGGAASAAALATVIALAYNFVEDTLGIHVVGGSLWLGAGAGEHHTRRKFLGPLNAIFAEKSGIDIGKGILTVAHTLGMAQKNHTHLEEPSHSNCLHCE